MLTKEISVATGNGALDLALDTIQIGKQAIVFVNTKRSAEKSAEDISKKIKVTEKIYNELSNKALKALSSPTKQCERLSRCIKKGIAFHHAGLVSKQRELIEDEFRNGHIKIICSTPSLAMGVDLPAFRAILKDVKRYGIRGLAYIPVLEYLQMAGRAGRPKFDSSGEAICVAPTKNDKKKLFDRYVYGEPEDIYSKLAVEPVLRTYLLSLIASNFVNSRSEIIDFFGKTFWAHQFMDMAKLSFVIDKMLRLLEEWEFISFSREEFVSANEVDNDKVKATVIGKRVAELYIDPLTAHNFIICLQNASDKKLDSFSFLQMISHTIEMKPLLRVSVKEEEIIQEELIKKSHFLLVEEPSLYEPEYEDFLNSVKTGLLLEAWINELSEEKILEEFNARPGELRAKLDIANWLLYASEELSRILHYQSLNRELAKVKTRLLHGVKEELLPLIKLKGIGRMRARKLYSNRIKTIKDVKDVDAISLAQIVGKAVATSLKEQVGQEVKEIPAGKRKGQISLGDY